MLVLGKERASQHVPYFWFAILSMDYRVMRQDFGGGGWSLWFSRDKWLK